MSDKWKIERVKGGGPGGQHRNKRETGIRITDPTTGLVATSHERSQAQNLRNAMKNLQEKIAKKNKKKKNRIKTKISAAQKKKRLESKRKHSEKKKNRFKGYDD